ncbi:MAG: hypothetical protein L6R40_008785 [Gallowayella cf. fulva]|nr:MAG: hypothetical protein L6R40_008785 [Xanthomendoza cf. fulva]
MSYVFRVFVLLTTFLGSINPTAAQVATAPNCRWGIDNCTEPLPYHQGLNWADSFQCSRRTVNAREKASGRYTTSARNCSFAAYVACAQFVTGAPRNEWQNATFGNCWVGAYITKDIGVPRPSVDSLDFCRSQVMEPLIAQCIGNPEEPDRVDGAFLNVVIPTVSANLYSWFMDYTKAAFVITTTQQVEAGVVPGIYVKNSGYGLIDPVYKIEGVGGSTRTQTANEKPARSVNDRLSD